MSPVRSLLFLIIIAIALCSFSLNPEEKPRTTKPVRVSLSQIRQGEDRTQNPSHREIEVINKDNILKRWKPSWRPTHFFQEDAPSVPNQNAPNFIANFNGISTTDTR